MVHASHNEHGFNPGANYWQVHLIIITRVKIEPIKVKKSYGATHQIKSCHARSSLGTAGLTSCPPGTMPGLFRCILIRTICVTTTHYNIIFPRTQINIHMKQCRLSLKKRKDTVAFSSRLMNGLAVIWLYRWHGY